MSCWSRRTSASLRGRPANTRCRAKSGVSGPVSGANRPGSRASSWRSTRPRVDVGALGERPEVVTARCEERYVPPCRSPRGRAAAPSSRIEVIRSPAGSVGSSVLPEPCRTAPASGTDATGRCRPRCAATAARAPSLSWAPVRSIVTRVLANGCTLARLVGDHAVGLSAVRPRVARAGRLRRPPGFMNAIWPRRSAQRVAHRVWRPCCPGSTRRRGSPRSAAARRTW